ncbi:MAG: PEP/pyruvate-binding domain-containing protein [Candidatus Aenigmarchaeota archaeon]|nr:PEP/pyruvate-binding domain-containing protein [Candidatus Aenigmarchaeota archaeon]
MKITSNVVWLSDKTNGREIVGTKALNLIEMVKLNLPVPNGFVIPYSFFNQFLEENKVEKEVYDLLSKINSKNIQKTEEKIKKLILSGKFSYDASACIETSFKKLKKNYNSVSARSSANCEDSVEASFAGQFESFLFIDNIKKLLNSIKECWASSYKSSTVMYSIMQGIEPKDIKMAVIIQGMVDSDKAGVMFTKNVWNSDENILIEATLGIGENVVGGLKNPDRYIVDRPKLKVMDKKIIGEEILSAKDIRQLTKYGLILEKHFKRPQDVEWCIKNNNIFLLQTRPITG